MKQNEAQFCLECFEEPPHPEYHQSREEAVKRARELFAGGRFRHIVLWGPGDGTEWVVEDTYGEKSADPR